MKLFECSTLVSASLVALGVHASTVAKEPTYEGTAKAINCLDTFNEARAAAGLIPFISAGNEFRVETSSGFAKNVCQALMTQTASKEITGFNKTIALAVQNGEDGDCAAAVTHFNGALSLFGDLPPAFSTSEDSVYRTLQAVSFVALYNPRENPKLDCGYFTCKKLETQTATPNPAPVGSQRSDPSIVEDQVVETQLKGLLCATTPQALVESEAPFEQKQYDKIKAAINSASTAMPIFATLAVAAVGLILF